MTSARPLELFQPASVDEARALLAASPPSVQSPTERRIRGDEHLDDTFIHGWRRPEWVWGARYADDPTPLGVVAASGTPFPDDTAWVLNFFGMPEDPAAAEALVAHATEAVLAAGADEASFFAPTDTTADDPSVAGIVGAAPGGGLATPRRAPALRVRAVARPRRRRSCRPHLRAAHRPGRPETGRLPPGGHARHARRP